MKLPGARRVRWSVVIVVVLAVFLGASYVWQGAKRQTAETTAQSLALPLAAICVRDPAVAANASADCAVASTVARDPGESAVVIDGVDGADGADGVDGAAGLPGAEGRGITGTSTVGGDLVVAYSDGTSTTLGPIVGADGTDGTDGVAGVDGVAGADGAAAVDGQPGAAGEDGAPGQGGTDGRGIVRTSIEGGRLIVLFSDGERADLGPIVGPAGRGIQGVDGASGRLLVTLTDGTVLDAGPLPPGPAGKDAPTVTRQKFLLDDGSTLDCARTGGTDTAPVYGCQTTPAAGGLPDMGADTGAGAGGDTAEGGAGA